MPDIFCPEFLSCPNPSGREDDWPIQNWTSEQPDSEVFIPEPPFIDPWPPLDGEWIGSACKGTVLCVSRISQEDANECVQREAAKCPNGCTTPTCDEGQALNTKTCECEDIPPGPPPPPVGPDGPIVYLWGNQEITCEETCPDGGTQSHTIGAGVVVAASQDLANRIARSRCEQQLAKKIICLNDMTAKLCQNQEVLYGDNIIEVVRGYDSPFTFEVVGGMVPPGMRLSQFGFDSASLWGTPTESGTFVFTVQCTNDSGITKDKQYTAYVLGIGNLTDGHLPDCKCDNPYSFTFDAIGGTGPFTFTRTAGTWPTGLTMTDDGHVSGTPVGPPQTNYIRINVTDSGVDEHGNPQPNSCSIETQITTNGPCIICPPAGSVCTPYDGWVTAIPAGCVFSGTPQNCLTLLPNGHLTGVPLAKGFIVTATDPDGNSNSKLCEFITIPPGGTASAFSEIEWQPAQFWADPHMHGGSVGGSGGHLSCVSLGWHDPGCTAYQAGGFVVGYIRNCSSVPWTTKLTLTWNLDPNPCPPPPAVATNFGSGQMQATVGDPVIAALTVVINTANPNGTMTSGDFTLDPATTYQVELGGWATGGSVFASCGFTVGIPPCS